MNDKELYHWSWPKGNNSPEYNHWYYVTHPEKWGQLARDKIKDTDNKVDDKALELYDKYAPIVKKEAGEIVDFGVRLSPTKVDNFLLSAYRSAKNKNKSATIGSLKLAGKEIVDEPVRAAKAVYKGAKAVGRGAKAVGKGIKKAGEFTVDATKAVYNGTKRAIQKTSEIVDTLKNLKYPKAYTSNMYEGTTPKDIIEAGDKWLDEFLNRNNK